MGFILSRLAQKPQDCCRLLERRRCSATHWCLEPSAAAAWYDMQGAKIARFGDNMREVAVTEGDKVEAQIKLGLSVNTWPVGDIVKIIDGVSEEQIDKLIEEYNAIYDFDKEAQVGGKYHESVRYQARIEAGIKSFPRSRWV